MRLHIATDRFRIGHTAYPGFPILVDNRGKVVEPTLNFFVYYLIQRGRAQSKHSWKQYGQSLYDFFGFLEANELDWDEEPVDGMPSVIAAYRDWALNDCKHVAKTINSRLRTICSFYRWAHEQEIIERLPFDLEEVNVRKRGGSDFFAHVDVSGNKQQSPDIMLREKKKPFQVLTTGQIHTLLTSMENETHRLIVRLGLQTGMRADELATFPASYVIDCNTRRDIRNIVVTLLDPTEMRTKGSVPRKIHIPKVLMDDLWQYKVLERPGRLPDDHEPPSALFLTECGNPYRSSAFWSIFHRMSKKLGFKVGPHLLRHSYATHTLNALRKHTEVGNVLLYLRDRLGHASINTTMQYLHLLDSIQDEILDEYQERINAFYAEAVS
jgi:integrase/recombinase XerD